MIQQLKVIECISQLEKAINTSIIDYISVQDSIVIIINVEDRFKWYKNKHIIKKLSKQVGKYFNYISFPCSIKQAVRQAVYPLKIEGVLIEKNNGKKIVYHFIDEL